MAALLINLKINTEEKFNIFKKTFGDISFLFPECHVKLRGEFAEKSLVHISESYFGKLKTYQNLPNHDWVLATHEIVLNIKSVTILIYIEDHILVAPVENLSKTLKAISKYKIDYLAYSFYRASMLSKENILPLKPIKLKDVSIFELNESSERILSKISSNYYVFSLTSIVSKKYFLKILENRNYKYKIHNSKIMHMVWFIFGYPKNRQVLSLINKFLSFIKVGLCLYPPDTPFNVETMCLEHYLPPNEKFKYALTNNELFANYDDDNGFYGESCIKRGMYPFKNIISDYETNDYAVIYDLILEAGESYDATYYNQTHRITNPPIVEIKVKKGIISVLIQNEEYKIYETQFKLFYSNKSPIINALEYSEITIKIYDELLI